MSETASRFTRQADLVPQARLTDLTVSVIGVGAIGRQVSLQLAAIGALRLQLIDFDRVDTTNITTQGYHANSLGLSKVEALATDLTNLDPTVSLDLISDRWRPTIQMGDAIFCCVDSISVRAAIWRAAGLHSRFWGDGRMLGEVLRVLTVTEQSGRQHYPTTLFDHEEVEPGRCTARSTIYTANIAAGLMLHQFTRWLRMLPTDVELSINLLASELTVID